MNVIINSQTNNDTLITTVRNLFYLAQKNNNIQMISLAFELAL